MRHISDICAGNLHNFLVRCAYHWIEVPPLLQVMCDGQLDPIGWRNDTIGIFKALIYRAAMQTGDGPITIELSVNHGRDPDVPGNKFHQSPQLQAIVPTS